MSKTVLVSLLIVSVLFAGCAAGQQKSVGGKDVSGMQVSVPESDISRQAQASVSELDSLDSEFSELESMLSEESLGSGEVEFVEIDESAFT